MPGIDRATRPARAGKLRARLISADYPLQAPAGSGEHSPVAAGALGFAYVTLHYVGVSAPVLEHT
jgi:hypothetical protein